MTDQQNDKVCELADALRRRADALPDDLMITRGLMNMAADRLITMESRQAAQSATRCSSCGAKEGEPCRGNCERAMPSSIGDMTDDAAWVEQSRAHGWGKHSDDDWARLHDLALRGATQSATVPSASAIRIANQVKGPNHTGSYGEEAFALASEILRLASTYNQKEKS